jgi:hypothetical protein
LRSALAPKNPPDLPAISDKPASVGAYLSALASACAEGRSPAACDHRGGSTPVIRYGMPALQLDGVTLLHFRAWKRHVGLYPIYRGPAAFEAVVGPCRSEKDSGRFPPWRRTAR